MGIPWGYGDRKFIGLWHVLHVLESIRFCFGIDFESGICLGTARSFTFWVN